MTSSGLDGGHNRPHTENMTTNQPRTVMDSLSGLIRLAVVLWLGWIALVLFVVLWTELPVLAGLLVVVALYALWVRHSRRRKMIRAHRIEYNNAKAERHRRDRVERALRNPDVTFEDHVSEWEKELQ